MKQILIKFWRWIVSLFVTRYRVSVSYNSQWGDSDDKHYDNVRSIKKQTDKILTFVDENKNPVTIRSAAGLNYRIEVID